MNQQNLYKFTCAILALLAITSYFFGFYFDENSAGAGGYDGDFKHIYNNLKIFLKHDFATSISHPDYVDSRPPSSYILHELLNPFANNEVNFRRSVFFVSLSVPVLFYFCLKQKFKDCENLLLILISSTISEWSLETSISFLFV